MPDPLNQADIDALLASVRQTQQDVGVDPVPPAPEPAAAWDAVPPEAAEWLSHVVATSWAPFGADGVTRATRVPPLRLATRVVQLSAPLDGRLWLFWEAAGAYRREASERFLKALRERIAPADCPDVEPDAAPPPEALLMPFVATLGGQLRSLTVAADPQALSALEQMLMEATAGPAAPEEPPAGGGVPVEALEVEAAVYVGGGLYPLSALSALRPGSLLPLETAVGQEAILAIGGRVVGYGEIVVTPDDDLALKLTRVVLGEEGRSQAPPWLQHVHPSPRRGGQG